MRISGSRLILTIAYLVIAIGTTVAYQNAIQHYDIPPSYSKTPLFYAVVAGFILLAPTWLSTKTKKEKFVLLGTGIAFALLGLYLMNSIIFDLQPQANNLNSDLSKYLGGGEWYVRIALDVVLQRISIYAVSVLSFVLIGIVICFIPEPFFRAVTFDSVQVTAAVIILLSALVLGHFIPSGSCAAGSAEYARVLLMSPRNTIGIKGNIYIYNNFINPNNSMAFVDNIVVILRADEYDPSKYEFIEAGYTQDANGFRCYGATKTLTTDYTKYWGPQFNGQWETGTHYHSFYLMQKELNNDKLFGAEVVFYSDSAPGQTSPIEQASVGEPESPIQPPQDSYGLVNMTFTLGGGSNMCFSGSTGNDPFNTMRGHYAGLGYYDSSVVLHLWSDTKVYYVIPYSVNVVYTYEFYTEGGFGTPNTPHPPQIRHGASGGYLTMTDMPI